MLKIIPVLKRGSVKWPEVWQVNEQTVVSINAAHRLIHVEGSCIESHYSISKANNSLRSTQVLQKIFIVT